MAGDKQTRGGQHIALIGYRGTGKSTVGRLLADQLSLPFYDLDAEAERIAGTTIEAIFAEQGEAAFRDVECDTLAQTMAKPPAVLATGGGIVLRDENRDRLRGATVVWLQASVETIVARVTADTDNDRPALTRRSLRDEVSHVLAERTPLYQDVANDAIDTEYLNSPAAVANEIARRLMGAA